MGEIIPWQKRARAAGGCGAEYLFVRLGGRGRRKLPLIALTRAGACIACDDTLPPSFIGRASNTRVEHMYEQVWRQGALIGARAVSAKTMRKRSDAIDDQRQGTTPYANIAAAAPATK